MDLKSESRILLSTLNITDSEKIITIKEDNNSDSSFLISHLIKQVFQNDDNGLSFLLLRNTIEHFQCIGKRLNYNLSDKIKENSSIIIEPLNTLVDDIAQETNRTILVDDPEELLKNLYSMIEESLQELLQKKSGLIFLFVDDLSVLIDLGLESKHVLYLINTLINFDERLNIVVSTHVSGSMDQIVSNALSYISDVTISVESLRTGRSFYVSGIITIARNDVPLEKYQFKAMDRGVQIFKPGESVYRI